MLIYDNNAAELYINCAALKIQWDAINNITINHSNGDVSVRILTLFLAATRKGIVYNTTASLAPRNGNNGYHHTIISWDCIIAADKRNDASRDHAP